MVPRTDPFPAVWNWSSPIKEGDQLPVTSEQYQANGFLEQRWIEIVWLVAAEEVRQQAAEGAFFVGVHRVFREHGSKEVTEGRVAFERDFLHSSYFALPQTKNMD